MATAQMLNVTGEVENIIGYSFSDPLILWEALQAAGASRAAGSRHFPDGNKRLAVLGDAILKLVLVSDWYVSADARGKIGHSEVTSGPHHEIGRASDIVQQVGSNANLDRVGRHHGLEDFICRSPSQSNYVSPATMTATVEAILGAVYLDSGINDVNQVMQRLGMVYI